jgi:RNA polymerase sigma factor (sigma-70 family)
LADSLLQRVATNEPAAVQAVIDRYGGLVWSLARRFSISSEDAEDAVQEIFLELWKSASRYDPAVGGEATFIAMIARRRLIDRARKAGRALQSQAIPEGGIAAPEKPGSGSGTLRSEQADEVSRAREALARLSPEQQRVLRLSIYHGLSHDEIARATGLPLGTVKTHARRGLIRIREILEVKTRTMESVS